MEVAHSQTLTHTHTHSYSNTHLVATQVFDHAGQIRIAAHGNRDIWYGLCKAWLIHHHCKEKGDREREQCRGGEA